MAVHDYDPYNYTLNDPLVRQWGHTADKDKRCSDYDEEGVVAVFENLKAAYLDKGIPVYLGEMGCSRHAEVLPRHGQLLPLGQLRLQPALFR